MATKPIKFLELHYTMTQFLINRGYYMPACEYEFYLRVFNSVSHLFAALTRKISSWRREDKIHIHKRACNILFIIQTYLRATFLTVFWRFPNIFWRFPKILEKLSEGQTIVSEHFRRCLRISEDNRRFPRKNRWCFDHRVTHLSTL